MGVSGLKSTSLEDYIHTVTTQGVQIDPVCVLVLAHMFHFHVAIFVSKGVWSTCKDRSLKKCRFGLIFHGGTEFSETVKVGQSKWYSKFLDAHAVDGALLSHLRTKTPGAVPPPELEPTNSELEDGDDTVQLTEDEDIDMDMENRPDMDIPIGLNATDFAASVPRSSSPKKDENNASDASSDLIVGEYVPPAPVRQRTCGPQTCPCCGSLEKPVSIDFAHKPVPPKLCVPLQILS